ncbi:Receptor-type tyrosine-protein phosphatase N2 [Nucella lapillus]
MGTDHDPRNPAYICTQGPLPHTVADFWQMVWEQGSVVIMVWEQGSVVIVMLTKLTEEGTAMCHRYWPEEGSDLYHIYEGSDLYHIYEVHLVSEHTWCDDYLVRSFYLKNLQTNETRTVTQFHFLTWPPLALPPSLKALLDFRSLFRRCEDASSGSGRTY